MAIYGNGVCVDYTFKITDELKTTTSQFMCVGQAPDTTTASDKTVSLCGVGASISAATGASFHCIGIVQSYQSATSEVATVRLFGIGKATCAHSIPAFAYVMAYHGISTTAMAGKICAIRDAASCTVATTSITAHCTVLGRSLEAGSTNTVIEVFINPSMYDFNLVGSLAVT